MAQYKCNVCYSTAKPSVVITGDKAGLFCAECGAWERWATREEGALIMGDNGTTLNRVQKDVHEELKRDYSNEDNTAVRDMLFMGLAEEAGEVAGIGKRIIRHFEKDLSEITTEHLTEELGDVLWYLTGIADGFGIKLEDIWDYNRKKLEARYGKTDAGNV